MYIKIPFLTNDRPFLYQRQDSSQLEARYSEQPADPTYKPTPVCILEANASQTETANANSGVTQSSPLSPSNSINEKSPTTLRILDADEIKTQQTSSSDEDEQATFSQGI